MKLRFILVFGLTLLAFESHAANLGIGDPLGIDPLLNWKTIETEHFRITFPDELTEISQKAAQYCEEAHRLLSPRLHWEASYKTPILILDNSDAANGLTSANLRLGIILMVTPPEDFFSTSYYDDWFRLLIIHEYTHFLNMDTTTSFWSAIRLIFGDGILPNSVWPSWMLEGLAVYMETAYTHAGRGRSPYYEMILRAATEEGVLDSDRFITLSRVNAPNPYYPGGETPYLFGYQLMNQVERSNDDALGEMSYRSSARVPFFINGNLENTTGKDWYAFWDDWVKETRTRMSKDLEKIKSEPVTKFHRLTSNGYGIYGSSVSPDGQWIAYTQDDLDERSGLYVYHLESKKAEKVQDKILGGSVSFTPDSQTIFLSSLERYKEYNLFSDLEAYSIHDHSTYTLTHGLRARDPDVSRDGTRVVFTTTETGVTGLSIADLKKMEGRWTLGAIQPLFTPSKYDRVSMPKFSPNGHKIIFSLHRNGKNSEELMEIDVETKKLTTLVSNGHYNRYPTISPTGSIVFTSDLTGVENLYRIEEGEEPELISNTTTGLAFPSFGPASKGNAALLYADIFSTQGWDLAEIEPIKGLSDTSMSNIRVSPPPAPKPAETSSKPDINYEKRDYSVFPSIWPREWAPFFLLSNTENIVGAGVLGFDSVDRHRYLAGADYRFKIEKADWVLAYSNRSLGPTLTLLAENYTNSETVNTPIDYSRTLHYSATASYPILFTYSSLTPSISATTEKVDSFYSINPPQVDEAFYGSFVPSADFVLQYSNAESSRLAISNEGGRNSAIGTRAYFDQSKPIWKGLLLDNEYLRVGEAGHSVFVPSIAASWVTRADPNSPDRVIVQGSRPEQVLGGTVSNYLRDFAGTSFSQLSNRGYPNSYFSTKAAAIAALEFRFPIANVHKAWGTNPFSISNISGFVFEEATYFPLADAGFTTLPSAGGGVHVNTNFFLFFPVTFSAEYDYGFLRAAGGQGDIFVEAELAAFTF